MKRLKKKLSLVLVSVCMLVFMQAMTCFAAEGTLQFSDPTGKVGEEVTVKVKIDANGAPIGDGDVELTYDSSKLEFVSGTNAAGGEGKVTLSASGTGTETELNYEIVFKALEKGTSTLEVSSSTAYLFSDETLNLEHGTATVTIEEGSARAAVTGSETIEISGTTYYVYNDFSEALIPDGFSEAAISTEDGTYNGVKQDASGREFIYIMKEASDDPIMAMYDKKEGFVLAAAAALTDDSYVYILGVMDGSDLPKTFGETTLNLNGTVFPVWQDSENTDYYIVNALGPSGEISYYQYDTIDGTYQRYVTRGEAAETTEETAAGNKLIDKVKTFIDKNLMIVVAVIAAVIFLLILIIIIQGVILGNKKSELEELYDDMDMGVSRPKNKKKSKKQSSEQEDFDDDEYDDDDDDFVEIDDEYDDEDDSYDEYDDEDDSYEEYDDEYDDDDDDDFDIDFIDL